MTKYILCFVFITLCVNNISSWKFFHNGRVKGGNLGHPSSHLLRDSPVNYTRWFTQNLDHFDPTNQETWQQRYFVNEEFFNVTDRKTVFLMIGGEGEASDKWMTNGTWITYAKQFGALCFQLEHRFYGKSHPTEDLSVENLRYLTSQQALADLAHFIKSMNVLHELPTDVKWIAFGGSYPGSLAAWLRQKYPHLVQGAMSASGPLLAKLDFLEYFAVVSDDLRNVNEECYSAVKTGTAQIDLLLSHMVGQQTVNKIFNLCDNIEIDNSLDVSNLYEALSGNFAGIAQYNKDNRISQNSDAAKITLDVLCDIMTNETIGEEVTRLAAVNTLILNSTNQTCLDYKYQKMIGEMKNVSWDSETAEGGRQWTYQTCTEFGFYQTSSNKPQIFGNKFPVEFYVQQCQDIFGSQFTEEFLNNVIERSNTFYGALDIEVDNVVFVHGSVDPWHALGITQTRSNGAPAIFIKGTAHCANMYPPSDDDLPQLKAARVEIQELIGTWLDL